MILAVVSMIDVCIAIVYRMKVGYTTFCTPVDCGSKVIEEASLEDSDIFYIVLFVHVWRCSAVWMILSVVKNLLVELIGGADYFMTILRCKFVDVPTFAGVDKLVSDVDIHVYLVFRYLLDIC